MARAISASWGHLPPPHPPGHEQVTAGVAVGGRERPYGGLFHGSQPRCLPCKSRSRTCCCCTVRPCLHLARSGIPFQVWGHCKEQRPGDGGCEALLEHLASVPGLRSQQEDNQERPTADHQHHQQDRSEKAGALCAATAGQASPRKAGQDPRKGRLHGALETRNMKASRVGGPGGQGHFQNPSWQNPTPPSLLP